MHGKSPAHFECPKSNSQYRSVPSVQPVLIQGRSIPRMPCALVGCGFWRSTKPCAGPTSGWITCGACGLCLFSVFQLLRSLIFESTRLLLLAGHGRLSKKRWEMTPKFHVSRLYFFVDARLNKESSSKTHKGIRVSLDMVSDCNMRYLRIYVTIFNASVA